MLKPKISIFANVLRFGKLKEATLSKGLSASKMRVFIQVSQQGRQELVVKDSYLVDKQTGE
jgi:hypothetical protein